MTEDTIKIMKLSSGEEIISRLKDDSNPRTFHIESPLKLQTVPKMTKLGVEEQISLTRWMHFAEEKYVDVPKTQVLGIANATIGLSRFYEYCLKKIDTEYDLYEDPSDAELQAIEEEEWEEGVEEVLDSYEIPSKSYH